MNIVNIETEQGTLPHTLNYRLMLTFQTKNAEDVKAANKFLMQGTTDLGEVFQVLYLAYLCACRYLEEEPLSRDDYYDAIGDDYQAIGETVRDLRDPNHRALGVTNS